MCLYRLKIMERVLGVFCVFVLILVAEIHSDQQKSVLLALKKGVEKLTENRTSVVDYLEKTKNNILQIPNKSVADDTFCKSCYIVVNTVIVYRRTGANNDSVKKYLEKLCNTFTEWGPVACRGYVDIEIGTILYIIDNKSNLTPQRVCAIYFQARKCVDPDAKEWIIPLPPAADNGQVTKSDVSQVAQAKDKKFISVLHLTDIHYDPLYKPGSNAVCDEPLCCQSGTPSEPKNAAGFWGDYNVCDMPQHSVNNVMQHIQETQLKDIDIIYYTGDIISHKSWTTSKDENTVTIKDIYNLFMKTFGNKTVYPILGNHEPHPTDFFSSDNIKQNQLSTQWIFDLSAEEWSKWLPADTDTTIRKGGYYSVLVKPGFRIIALNSNVCFTNNLWLFYEDEDPYQQLAWLVEQLYKAEKQNEKVHILSHIPPGEMLCHRQWSNQFHNIVNRFSKTISAQFNGHTHIDELRIFYHPNDTNKVINVAFNGGSLTTFVGFNPNYRIYQIDPSSLIVENYDHFIYNLTKANENKTQPEWYKLYSFKEAYGLNDLNLDSFNKLMKKISNDSYFMHQYFRFSVRDSDVKLKEGCNMKCLQQLICYITAVETDKSVNC